MKRVGGNGGTNKSMRIKRSDASNGAQGKGKGVMNTDIFNTFGTEANSDFCNPHGDVFLPSMNPVKSLRRGMDQLQTSRNQDVFGVVLSP